MKPVRKRISTLAAWGFLFASLGDLARRASADAASREESTCWNCAHLRIGHLDQMVNWMHCKCGHRLIPQEKLICRHYLFNDPGERVVRVTVDNWTEFNGSGPAMLGQPACEDWSASGRRVALAPPCIN